LPTSILLAESCWGRIGPLAKVQCQAAFELRHAFELQADQTCRPEARRIRAHRSRRSEPIRVTPQGRPLKLVAPTR